MSKKKLIPIIAVVIIIFIGLIILLNLNNYKPKEIKTETTTTSVSTIPTEIVTEATTTYPPFVNGLSLKANEAKNINSETVGWIRISNTVIDYAVLRAKDNDFYINHDINKKPSDAGYVFMDYRCDFEKEIKLQSDNILMYGHNMYDGSMFSALKKYADDPSFYEQNPIVEVSSLYEDFQYKIFAFMLCNGAKGSDFEFWNYINFPRDYKKQTAEECFDEYIAKINDKSLVKTNVDVKFGDKFIALSTCNNGDLYDDTRFVVLARRVRPGEDLLSGVAGSVRK